MAVVERGLIRGGQIVLPTPLALPEGTEVVVQIEPIARPRTKSDEKSFSSLPFFGMWADRKDLSDSADWIHKEREQWHQRASRRE